MASKNKPKQSQEKKPKKLYSKTFPKTRAQAQLEIHQAHAQYFERTFSLTPVAVGFIKYALASMKILEQLDVDKLVVEPSHFFDANVNNDAYADMVYRIPLKDEPNNSVTVYALLEHKSYNDFRAVFQLGYYAMQILHRDSKKNKRGKLPLVIPILIHHSKKAFTGPVELKDLFPRLDIDDKHLLNYQPIVIDLNTITENSLPATPNDIRLNIVLRAMKAVFASPQPPSLSDCINRLLPYIEDKPEYKEFAQITVWYFLSAVQSDKSWLEKTIEEASTIYKKGYSGVKMLKTIREQYIEQGREQGREEGSVETLHESILNLLRTRFTKVPATVEKRIRLIQDKVILDSLLIESALCKTLNEFKEKF